MSHPGWTVEILAARMPQRLRDMMLSDDSNLRSLAQAWVDAWLSLWQQDLEDVETQIDQTTATGNFLRLRNRFFGARAPDGASDARLRFHLALELLRRRGAISPESTRQAIASALGTGISQVSLFENVDPDTGAYVPAQFYITFDQGLLEDLGFATSEFAEAFADIDRTLGHIAGTGIKAFALTVGGAAYDTAVYDQDTYGS